MLCWVDMSDLGGGIWYIPEEIWHGAIDLFFFVFYFCWWRIPGNAFLWLGGNQKMSVRYIVSCVSLWLSLSSPIYFMQYMGMCVFSLTISLMMVVRIFIFHLFIIIKPDIQITSNVSCYVIKVSCTNVYWPLNVQHCGCTSSYRPDIMYNCDHTNTYRSHKVCRWTQGRSCIQRLQVVWYCCNYRCFDMAWICTRQCLQQHGLQQKGWDNAYLKRQCSLWFVCCD